MNQTFQVNKKTKLFAFDLDGTIYFGEKIVEGAIELLTLLEKSFKVVFFTNNSSKTREEIHQKLIGLGINCKVEDVYAASTATALYLQDEKITDLYVVGSKGFVSEIEAVGLNVTQNKSAINLVVGLDFNFNYEKIKIALSVLQRGGKFIICNEDASFPIENNEISPGSGAMVGAISAAANRKPDYAVGKPNTYILSKIAQLYCVTNEEIIVVGDSYESDIQMALNYQCKSILIGKLGHIDNQSILMVDSITDILQFLKEK